MTNNRDALYAFLEATTKAAASLQAAIEASADPVCSCEQSTLTYDGPQVDCDVHGLPSAAFEAGRRQGAEEERAKSMTVPPFSYTATVGRRSQ